jgi:Fur family ferric uptake transcriptional regulator
VSELESVEVAVSPSDKFQEYLATQGMRLTQERAIIVEDVFSQHEHFDAEQIVERLTPAPQQGGRRVSRASVYRTLTLLEEAGLIRKVARTNDRDVYEHDYGYPQHDHLICRECGELFEFYNAEISRVLEQVAAEFGFRMSGHRLEVYGRCSECSKPQRRRNPKLDLL